VSPVLAASADIQIEADHIAVGDIVQFRIIVTDTFSGNQPEIKPIDGLKIDSLGSSSQFSFVSGKQSSSLVFTYIITAIKPGAYNIGPFEINNGGKKIATNAVKLTVTRGASGNQNPTTNNQGSPSNSNQSDSQLFFNFSIPKTKMYVGEKVPIKFRIYIGDVRINGPIRSLDFNQTQVLLDPPLKTGENNVTMNGQDYVMVECSGILTPVKTGAFTLGPAKMICDVMIRKRSSNPFNDFFDDGYVKRTVQINSNNAVNINALPLPDSGKPAVFSGGIGRFQLNASAGPTEVLQGDPITVKMTVSGSGNLRAIAAPHLANTNGFKVYDAQRKEASGPNENPGSEVNFEQVVIPLDPKVKQINPFVFSYFDPDAGIYREARTAAIPITVKPNPNFNAASTMTTANNPGDDEQLGQDIIFIKDNPGQLQLNHKPLYEETWFWILQLLPVLGFLAAFIYRKNQEFLQSDTPESRALRATNKASRRLTTAKELKINQKFDALLEELHLTVRHYLGEKFNLAAAGMTVKVVEILATKGIASGILQEIQAFFERYDYYRFTQTALNPATAQELWDRVERIIIALENWKKSRVKPAKDKAVSTRSGIHGKN
jgi:hypothetical protein